MSAETGGDRSAEVLALVREGWDHLRLQRPLAAWASWRQALRIAPEDRAATEALEILEASPELPAAARVPRSFRSPRDEGRRSRWSARFAGRDLSDLERAAEAFADLTRDDPTDSAAYFNLGLSQAWLGRNAEAIEELGRSVDLDAPAEAEAAVASWTLAEVLRSGGGAEALADDLTHTLTLDWDGRAPVEAMPGVSAIRPLPSQSLPPGEAEPVHLAEWLEAPLGSWADYRGGRPLPRVLATLIAGADRLDVSSPDLPSLLRVEQALAEGLGHGFRPIDRRSSPLPLRFADAAAWLFRVPAEPTGPEEQSVAESARRAAIERYYEQIWITRPRLGLADSSGLPRSPAEAASGDEVARAKLAAVVKFREQLAVRPRMAAIVEGYPFDRLRRRLGLPLNDENAIDRADVSSMGREELGGLDLATLADSVLLEAHRAAVGVCDPATVERFEAALSARGLVADPREGVPL